MDLMADLHRINQSPEAIRARRARREAREKLVYDRIGAAMGKPSAVRGLTRHAALVDDAARFDSLSREAASSWNMYPDQDSYEGALLGEQHPGAAALLVVREAMGEYRIPTHVDLRYRSMKRLSGHGAYGMDDGFVFVQASFSSMSGPRHYVDIPVVVRAGRMLSPSVMIHQGVERIITQHTIDDIIGMGEFVQKVPDRLNMYSPPAPERQGAPARQVPIVRPETMYSILPRRTLTSRRDIQAALSGHRVADGPVGPPADLTEPPLPQSSQINQKIRLLQQQRQQTRDPAMQAKLDKEIQRLKHDLEFETGNFSFSDTNPVGDYATRLRHLQQRGGALTARTAAILVQAAGQELAPEHIRYYEQMFMKPMKAWGAPEWQEFYRRYDPSMHKVIPAGQPEPQGGGLFQKLKRVFDVGDMEQDAGVEGHACMAAAFDGKWMSEKSVADALAEPGIRQKERNEQRRRDRADAKRPPSSLEDVARGVYAKMKQHNAPPEDVRHFLPPGGVNPADKQALFKLVRIEFAKDRKKGASTLEGRVVQGFYEPQVTRFVENGELGKDVPGADGSDLDPAERPTEDHLWTSAAVRTTREIYVYGRAGTRWKIPKGEEGEVVRDIDGTNRAIYVRWYGLGYAATVARDALRLA